MKLQLESFENSRFIPTSCGTEMATTFFCTSEDTILQYYIYLYYDINKPLLNLYIITTTFESQTALLQ